jgi:hypothetical protein
VREKKNKCSEARKKVQERAIRKSAKRKVVEGGSGASSLCECVRVCVSGVNVGEVFKENEKGERGKERSGEGWSWIQWG